MNRYKKAAQTLLKEAGIEINGGKPWDIQVHNKDVYKRVFAEGSLGFGEAYMDGWWDAKALDEFFNKVLGASLEKKVHGKQIILNALRARLFNMQTNERSKKVAQEHYDIGNDFYEKMLDSRMQYTCGYWKDTHNMEDAQRAKLDLVCKKLQLKPGEHVLEIGSGWGWFARYAAENYGVTVTAYNISKEQVAYAREQCKGLPVEFKLEDYRNATGIYDKVATIGVCEHIGYKNYRTFMEITYRCLKPHGLFLVHTIGGNKSVTNTDAWIEKYIFPNSMLPSVKQLGKAAEGLFVMEDWHSFGAYYDKTLMAWYENFVHAWPELKDKYGDRFYRMWEYYLLSCAGSFRARHNQLWQIVLSPEGVRGGWKSVR